MLLQCTVLLLNILKILNSALSCHLHASLMNIMYIAAEKLIFIHVIVGVVHAFLSGFGYFKTHYTISIVVTFDSSVCMLQLWAS